MIQIKTFFCDFTPRNEKTRKSLAEGISDYLVVFEVQSRKKMQVNPLKMGDFWTDLIKIIKKNHDLKQPVALELRGKPVKLSR